MDRSIPWQWHVRSRTLIVRFDSIFRTLGWAPLRGGFASASAVANYQVKENEREATEAPRKHLRNILRELALNPNETVAMMTGANVRRAAYASARRGPLIAGAWCTAGCSNALRVGDRATFNELHIGTINLIVAVNQSLEDAAMVEAIQIATEARVIAVQEAQVISTRSGQPATGTGTDCIVIAAPAGKVAHRYCGKHTLVGELIGRAAMGAVTRALAKGL